MAGKRDALVAKCDELALEVQCILGLADEAKSLRACMTELVESFKKMLPNVWAKRRTADMEMVAKQARTENMARIAHLKGDVHELKGKLEFSGTS